MELNDCAYPLLVDVVQNSDPIIGFKDADIAILVGARPRGPGMERKDLLECNAQIFAMQGKALNEVAYLLISFFTYYLIDIYILRWHLVTVKFL